ncbi:MAG TPA: hypothetical protein DEB50_11370 [Desulfobacter sp.]|nr:hypothetical protein [Desulfobacter sp.]
MLSSLGEKTCSERLFTGLSSITLCLKQLAYKPCGEHDQCHVKKHYKGLAWVDLSRVEEKK